MMIFIISALILPKEYKLHNAKPYDKPRTRIINGINAHPVSEVPNNSTTNKKIKEIRNDKENILKKEPFNLDVIKISYDHFEKSVIFPVLKIKQDAKKARVNINVKNTMMMFLRTLAINFDPPKCITFVFFIIIPPSFKT